VDPRVQQYRDVIDAWLEREVAIAEGRISAGSDESFWAWEDINNVALNHPEEAWPVVLELIRRAPSNRVLASIAAGPLEDLIRKHTNLIIDKVDDAARRDPKFRLCLTGVWYGKDLSPDVRARIEKYTSASPSLDDD